MQPCSYEVIVLRVERTLNQENASVLREHFLSILARPGNVVLDLRRAVLDSAGLGAVLSLQRQLELRGRRLLVVAEDPQFLTLLEKTGTRGALRLYPNAERALECARTDGTTAVPA